MTEHAPGSGASGMPGGHRPASADPRRADPAAHRGLRSRTTSSPTRRELRTYECDGLTGTGACPALVVLPGDGRRGRRRRARLRRGTASRSSRAAPAPGLSGGALPLADGVVIVAVADARGSSRSTRASGRVVVEPGVTNLDVTPGRRAARLLLRARPVQPAGLLDRRQRRGELRRRALPQVRLHRQPRARRCTIVLPDGELTCARRRHRRRRPATTCSARSSAPRARSGSSTEITLRLIRAPEAVRDAARRRSTTPTQAGERGLGDHRARASCPAAIEMMDALAIEAAEAAVRCRLPGRRRRGPDRRARRRRPREVEDDLAAVERICARAGACEIRAAADAGERARDLARPQGRVRGDGPDQPRLLRPGRRRPAHRSCRGAAPDRRALGGGRAARRQRLPRRRRQPAPARPLRRRASTGEAERAEELAERDPRRCASTHGGSITGEHGVGVDKACVRCRACSARTTSTTMQLLRCAFDPAGLVQPGQGLPDAAAVRRGARRPARRRIRWSPPAWRRSVLMMATLAATGARDS